MTLEELKKEWETDSHIDETKLSQVSLGTAKLHSKYLNILIDTKQKLIKRKYDFNILKKIKIRYYNGELSKEELEDKGWSQYQNNKPIKSQMGEILDGDEDLVKEKMRIEYLEIILYFLESVLGSLKTRGFDIKNSISWNSYLAGN